MAENISELAKESGVSVESAQKGLGAILELLKSKLPADAFSKISEAVPETDRLMSRVADTGKEATGGIVGAVKGAVGKLFGGGGATDALISKFGQLGMSADQIQGFVPKVMDFLKSKLPENVMSQITHLLPIPQETTH